MLFDYHIHSLGLTLVLPLLYAEIHYRIRGLFSRYDQKEPEIIADVPHRLDPGQSLPVLLLIKDADRFPVKLLQIKAILYHNDEPLEILHIRPQPEIIAAPLWHRIYPVQLPTLTNMPVKVDVMITIECNGQTKTIVNDNYRLTSHKPFTVYADAQPLPRNANWYFGDLHYHSDYSSDQVEYGAPLEATETIARAMGLDFFAATDHSYDLDDYTDNYLRNDPVLAKWHDLQSKIKFLNNSSNSFVVIPGEELSAGNSANRNVHFLLLNSNTFFPGSGDSAEIWFKTRPETTIAQVLRKLEAAGLAIAAHPEDKPPFLQWLLIKRGKWRNVDYQQKGLHGVQMWNGRKAHFMRYGLRKWISLLLQGNRLTLFAGNDAHGNFNRFRQLSTPFLTMSELDEQIFADARTGVYVENAFNLENLVSALRSGRVIVTDGPFAEFSLTDNDGKTAYPGAVLNRDNGVIRISAKSTPNFGSLILLKLYAGDYRTKKETCLLTLQPETGCFEYEMEKELTGLPRSGYLRLMAISNNNKKQYHCFTNPVYLRRE